MNEGRTVSIERSADYLYQKAVENASKRRYFDAFELLRTAIDRSPDKPEYRLRLVQLYEDAGYKEKARRLLMDMLARKDAPVECMYRLTEMQCAEGNLNGAFHTLHTIGDADAADWDRIEQMQDLIYFSRREGGLQPRDHGRMQHLAELAEEHIREGRFSRATRLLKRCVESGKLEPEARALYAMCCMLMGQSAVALEQAGQISVSAHADARSLCMAAQVYTALSRPEEARRCLDRAARLNPEDTELYLMLLTMSEAGLHARVAEETRLALQYTPCDRYLLHMRAVALAHIGAEASEYRVYWKRILRIDPQDAVASFYLEKSLDETFGAEDMTYVYALNGAHTLEYARRFAEYLCISAEEMKDRWRGDAEFRCMLHWAAECDLEQARQAAVSILTVIADDEAVSLLRSMLADSATPDSLKMRIVQLARYSGIEDGRLTPLYASAEAALLSETDLLSIAHLTVGERQMIRFASELLEERYNVDARVPITVIWISCRRDGLRRHIRLNDTEAVCAALSWCFMDAMDESVPLKTLAKLFGGRLRRAEYYKKHMERYLKKNGDVNETV